MANFVPLKNYLLYCIDRLIDKHRCLGPFLDIGCGIGDVSRHLARKEWHGEAIDISPDAVENTRTNLTDFNAVKVTQRCLLEQKGAFNTIFLLDVLEHIEDDISVLKKINTFLNHDGHLIISVPHNAREWRWDDDVYGHYRRYDYKEIEEKLLIAGFIPLTCWDFTFPCFWLMRRVYAKLKSAPEGIALDNHTKTRRSALNNAWDIPIFSKMLSEHVLLWKLLYAVQFKFFKNKINRGHEILILASKVNK
ncbi:MAG: class I SAM-dependent methyltransferase [Candidatus Omnitrophota bacterium]|nr:class I SAM-dependent methyltransferase [Candidatus Omnitrophota bacterium]